MLDTYDCDDEGRAFELLRDFSQRRTLVLLASDAPLFRRIRSSLPEFPRARVVELARAEPPGERIESFQPSFHYEQSSIRRTWREVRAALEQEKVAVDESGASISTRFGKNEISLAFDSTRASENVPVLITTTYSPRWQARDGSPIYAATPFFMLTFARGPVHLAYERNAADAAGLWASAFTLLALCGYVVVVRRRKAEGGCVEEKRGVRPKFASLTEKSAEGKSFAGEGSFL